METNYLDQFPADQHTFIKDKFLTSYVFTEDNYEFGQEDTIQLAKGPKEMKARVRANFEKLLTFELSPEQTALVEQVLPTIDSSDEFLKEIKTEVDKIWATSREYLIRHPRKEDKKKSSVPPSDKQLSFLKSLGYGGTVPKSKSEAMRLIDEWKKTKRN